MPGRIYTAGVPTELHVYSGAVHVHGFELFAPELTLDGRFIQECGDALDQFPFG